MRVTKLASKPWVLLPCTRPRSRPSRRRRSCSSVPSSAVRMPTIAIGIPASRMNVDLTIEDVLGVLVEPDDEAARDLDAVGLDATDGFKQVEVGVDRFVGAGQALDGRCLDAEEYEVEAWRPASIASVRRRRPD